MLKAVFVDWFGTLSDSRFFEHWSVEGHPRQAAFESLQAWWFDPASQPFLDGWLTGTRNVDDFIEAMSDLLRLSQEEIRAEFIEGFHHWTLLNLQTKPLLQAMRDQGVRVVLATENVDACIRWALLALNLDDSFDAILSSHELGARKDWIDDAGRNRFFGGYLETERIGAGESVLIDDSAHLGDVAASCGIRFFHAPNGSGPGKHLRRLLLALP